MNLILCVDNNGGMSFFGRRQSMDRVLREKALELAGEGKLWMDAYSAGQFQNEGERVCVTSDPCSEVPEDGWFFLELADPEQYLPKANRVAVFHWNREYPSDRRFPLHILQNLIFREDFPGYSHENVTLEVYQL